MKLILFIWEKISSPKRCVVCNKMDFLLTSLNMYCRRLWEVTMLSLTLYWVWLLENTSGITNYSQLLYSSKIRFVSGAASSCLALNLEVLIEIECFHFDSKSNVTVQELTTWYRNCLWHLQLLNVNFRHLKPGLHTIHCVCNDLQKVLTWRHNFHHGQAGTIFMHDNIIKAPSTRTRMLLRPQVNGAFGNRKRRFSTLSRLAISENAVFVFTCARAKT